MQCLVNQPLWRIKPELDPSEQLLSLIEVHYFLLAIVCAQHLPQTHLVVLA